mmetsp:Transcript_6556/g.20642  ORF Transcript_6556/g.20642 Transcript_6556/m.20642 type:complete len:84 (-) Transcript_6556:32-283(-)
MSSIVLSLGGGASLRTTLSLPRAQLIQLAHAAGTLGTCLGRPLKLKPFAVEVLTMHARQPRWPGHARAAPRAAPLGIGPSAAR